MPMNREAIIKGITATITHASCCLSGEPARTSRRTLPAQIASVDVTSSGRHTTRYTTISGPSGSASGPGPGAMSSYMLGRNGRVSAKNAMPTVAPATGHRNHLAGSRPFGYSASTSVGSANHPGIQIPAAMKAIHRAAGHVGSAVATPYQP
jgi:hypothetical protein